MDIRLRDPLSTETRTERRTLLGASAIGIVIVKTGLIPSKISALGIEFTQTDQRSLLLAIAAIVSYFLVAFLIYATSDFLAWRSLYQEAHTQKSLDAKKRYEQGMRMDIVDQDRELTIEEHDIQKFFKSRHVILRLSSPMSLIRAMFEFVVPILVGVYSIILLVRAPV